MCPGIPSGTGVADVLLGGQGVLVVVVGGHTLTGGAEVIGGRVHGALARLAVVGSAVGRVAVEAGLAAPAVRTLGVVLALLENYRHIFIEKKMKVGLTSGNILTAMLKKTYIY